MKRGRSLLSISALALLCALAVSGSAVAVAGTSDKTAGGLIAYLGVLPAAMIQGHDKDHPETSMHGGIPSGERAYHVMVAVFDAASGERIEDATVEGDVTPLGLASVARRLYWNSLMSTKHGD